MQYHALDAHVCYLCFQASLWHLAAATSCRQEVVVWPDDVNYTWDNWVCPSKVQYCLLTFYREELIVITNKCFFILCVTIHGTEGSLVVYCTAIWGGFRILLGWVVKFLRKVAFESVMFELDNMDFF